GPADPQAQDHQHPQPPAEARPEVGPLHSGDVPDLLHRVLARLGDTEAAPDDPDDPDSQAEPVRSQRVDVLLDLGTDDREFGERRVQQSTLERRIIANDESEPGDQQQQQGEEGEEAVVREQGGEGAAPIVTELLDYPEGECRRTVAALVAVESPYEALCSVHPCLSGYPPPRLDTPVDRSGTRQAKVLWPGAALVLLGADPSATR